MLRPQVLASTKITTWPVVPAYGYNSWLLRTIAQSTVATLRPATNASHITWEDQHNRRHTHHQFIPSPHSLHQWRSPRGRCDGWQGPTRQRQHLGNLGFCGQNHIAPPVEPRVEVHDRDCLVARTRLELQKDK